MRVQSVKFYVKAPEIKEGQLAYRSMSTFFAVGQEYDKIKIQELEVTYGPSSPLLEVTLSGTGGSKTFIYQLADILGRVEVTS